MKIIKYGNLVRKYDKALVDNFFLYLHNFEKTNFFSEKINLFTYHKLNNYIKKQKPLAYIFKYKYFYSDSFFVNSNVLIPRDETEVIIEYLSNWSYEPKNIIDVGTGSGCIAISVSRIFKNSNIIATDISSKAIKVAKKNSKILSIVNITFKKTNLVNNINLSNYDLIISNLPYIKKSYKLDKSVINYEPKIALFADSEGLKLIYDLINDLISKNYNGRLIIEFGYDQKDKIDFFLQSKNISNYIFFKDNSNIERFCDITFEKK